MVRKVISPVAWIQSDSTIKKLLHPNKLEKEHATDYLALKKKKDEKKLFAVWKRPAPQAHTAVKQGVLCHINTAPYTQHDALCQFKAQRILTKRTASNIRQSCTKFKVLSKYDASESYFDLFKVYQKGSKLKRLVYSEKNSL